MNIKSHCNHLRNRNVIVLFIQKKKKQLPVYLYLFTWPLQHGDDVDATCQRNYGTRMIPVSQVAPPLGQFQTQASGPRYYLSHTAPHQFQQFTPSLFQFSPGF